MIKKTFFLILYLLCLTSFFVNAQPVWTQIGDDINGSVSGDNLGYAVAADADVSIVALGAYFSFNPFAQTGYVRVYQDNAGVWQQLGADLGAEASGDVFGWSVSLSDDGSVLAVGAIYNDGAASNAGHVRVFHYSEGNWLQIGNDIDGDVADDYFGYDIQLSADGSILAIGAPGKDQFSLSPGYVKVYYNNAGSWEQIGSTVYGEVAGDRFGYSVDLSDDGSIVAAGAIYNGGNGVGAGHTRVYQYQTDTWVQLGNDIDGELAGDLSGHDVALSSDGSYLAVGARANDGNGSFSGHVRVWHWDTGSWVQFGQDIDGENANENSGWSVDLNQDGSVVIVGVYNNSDNGTVAGQVRVYKNTDGTWQNFGPNISGEAAEDHFGCEVAISHSGNRFLAGAHYNDGVASNAGHARIFEYSCALGEPPIPDSEELLPVTGECSATITETPTAHDVCGAPLTGTTTDPLTYSQQGTFTVTWYYEDSEGNISSQEQNLIIEDETIPTIECLTDQSINLSSGQTSYTVIGNEFDPLNFDDNCTVQSIENDFNNANTLNGAVLPVGNHTVVWNVYDEAGNTASCSFDIEIIANSAVANVDPGNFSCSPNPFSEQLCIEYLPDSIFNISITDISGKIVYTALSNNSGKSLLHLQDLQSGIYFLNVKGSNTYWITKIIKQ